MFVLPNGAYPSASRRFLDAVQDYRRKLKQLPEPERGSREWYAAMRGDNFSLTALLRGHFHQPLLYARLHRTNWRAARPSLIVSLGVDGREGLCLSVSSSEEVQLFWGYGYREHYVADAGHFKDGFYGLTLLKMPLENGLRWSFDDGYNSYYTPDLKKFRDERHLCLLALQAKLHHLSLFFDCRVNARLVEFGPDCLVDWRREQNGGTEDEPGITLFSKDWGSPRLRALLPQSGLSVADLYVFATQYLAKVEESLQPVTLGQYLANSHTGTVTHEDVAELLTLCDPKLRAKRWLADLAEDERFPTMKRERYGWLDSFAREANLSEDEALLWMLKHHPATYETYAPSERSIRKILASRDAKKLLSPKAAVHLDEVLAKAVRGNATWLSGMRAQHYLEGIATSMGFKDFDELVVWTKSRAPLTHRAALDLAEAAIRVSNEAKAQASAKRAATKKARAAL